jgi:hypothetical protein
MPDPKKHLPEVKYVLRAYSCDLCNPTSLTARLRAFANDVSLNDHYERCRNDDECKKLGVCFRGRILDQNRCTEGNAFQG